MKKIFELNKNIWGSGIALQPSAQRGGLFYQASNFDPFEVLDIMQPSRAPVRYGNATVTKQINYFANFTQSNLPYLYGFAGLGTTTALYEIKGTDGTVTDVSAQIATTASARGCVIWYDNVSATRGFIYATDTTVRANSVPVALANDLEILTGLTSAEHKFEPGADGNLYFTNGNKVGKITSTTGTAGNILDAFTFPAGYTIRDIANDGRYLVIIADNQTGTDQLGTYNCIIGYWDYASEQLTQRYNLQLNSVVAVQIMNGNAHVFSKEGIYICNVSAYPQILFPLNGTSSLVNSFPTKSSQVIKRGNDVILWGDGNSSKVYGYGSLGLGDKHIMFHPASVGAGNITALGVQGLSNTVTPIFIASSTPALYIQGISSTRDTASLITTSIVLPQPFKLSYIRVVAREVLSSGQTMTLSMSSQNYSKLASSSQTFSFTADGAKQSKYFLPITDTIQMFNDFALSFTSNFAIQSIEVWGEPLEGPNQSI